MLFVSMVVTSTVFTFARTARVRFTRLAQWNNIAKPNTARPGRYQVHEIMITTATMAPTLTITKIHMTGSVATGFNEQALRAVKVSAGTNVSAERSGFLPMRTKTTGKGASLVRRKAFLVVCGLTRGIAKIETESMRTMVLMTLLAARLVEEESAPDRFSIFDA